MESDPGEIVTKTQVIPGICIMYMYKIRDFVL